jgi:hypothetical protein
MVQRTLKYRAQKGGVFPSITESRVSRTMLIPLKRASRSLRAGLSSGNPDKGVAEASGPPACR